MSLRRMQRDVRELTADELGIGYAAAAEAGHGSSAPDAPRIVPDDPRIAKIHRLLQQFGGVIFTGPPGTGKSWLAGQVADVLTGGDDARRVDIQFHASYQFEDFVEGYRPEPAKGGFTRREGVFLHLVTKALDDPNKEYVAVIDELSRADVGRVFGEVLTYIERSKRGLPFTLPSGEPCSIPGNVYVIATMNPLDRGVDEVDAAFERRFAKIDMLPDAEALESILATNEVDPEISRRLVGWFRSVNARAKTTPAAAVGHAYFTSVVDADTLQDVWDYQLKYLVDRAFQLDHETGDEVRRGWDRIFLTDARDPDGSVGA